MLLAIISAAMSYLASSNANHAAAAAVALSHAICAVTPACRAPTSCRQAYKKVVSDSAISPSVSKSLARPSTSQARLGQASLSQPSKPRRLSGL